MIIPRTVADHAEELRMLGLSDYPQWVTLDECLKSFRIYIKTARANLDNYFLLRWSPEYFLTKLEGDDKSYITHSGIRYYVIYTELLSPEYVKEYEQLKLSFRKPTKLSFGFVLVKAIRTE